MWEVVRSLHVYSPSLFDVFNKTLAFKLWECDHIESVLIRVFHILYECDGFLCAGFMISSLSMDPIELFQMCLYVESCSVLKQISN